MLTRIRNMLRKTRVDPRPHMKRNIIPFNRFAYRPAKLTDEHAVLLWNTSKAIQMLLDAALRHADEAANRLSNEGATDGFDIMTALAMAIGDLRYGMEMRCVRAAVIPTDGAIKEKINAR